MDECLAMLAETFDIVKKGRTSVIKKSVNQFNWLLIKTNKKFISINGFKFISSCGFVDEGGGDRVLFLITFHFFFWMTHERLILPRILTPNFSPLQSAYRPGFSIETSLSHLQSFRHIVTIVTALSWLASTNWRPLTPKSVGWDATILALMVLPSLGFTPIFPADLNMLSLAIILPPCRGSPGLCPRAPCFSRPKPHPSLT